MCSGEQVTGRVRFVLATRVSQSRPVEVDEEAPVSARHMVLRPQAAMVELAGFERESVER